MRGSGELEPGVRHTHALAPRVFRRERTIIWSPVPVHGSRTSSWVCLHPANSALAAVNPQVLASKLVGRRQVAQQEDGGAVATTSAATTTPTTRTDVAAAAAAAAASGAYSGTGDARAAASQSHGDVTTREGGATEGTPPWRDVAESGGSGTGTAAKPRRSASEEETVRIVAVDLQEMAPIEGVKQLQVRTGVP